MIEPVTFACGILVRFSVAVADVLSEMVVREVTACPFLARRLLHDLPKVPRYDRHGRLAKTYEHPQISSPAACRSLPQPAAASAACRSLPISTD